MASYSVDVRYAFLQLSLTPDATADEIAPIFDNTVNDRFATRGRIDHVKRFTAFFTERRKLGDLDAPFLEIRRLYHRKAMALHPDRNQNNKAAEDELKSFNAAYELIEAVYREAKAHFAKPEAEQKQVEDEVRQQTLGERARKRAATPPEQKTSEPEPTSHDESTQADADTGERRVKYLAASIPRYIRTSRLFYLALHAVIASHVMGTFGKGGMVYDIIMLPEREFIRARLQLGVESIGGVPELRMSKLTPAYIPQDIKEIFIAADDPNPHATAKILMLKKFNLQRQ